jgi:hypothetical protein
MPARHYWPANVMISARGFSPAGPGDLLPSRRRPLASRNRQGRCQIFVRDRIAWGLLLGRLRGSRRESACVAMCFVPWLDRIECESWKTTIILFVETRV